MLSIGVTYADVTLTGTVNQVYTTQNVTTSAAGTLVPAGSSTITSIGSRGGATGDTFITFAGSEDLGDGLKASFKIEPRVNMNGSDSTTPGLFGLNREAHVDLSGAFGSVAIGNNYTPLFLQAVAPFDVNGSTNAVGYTVSNNTTFNATNSIAYTLPKFVEGLTAQIAINKAAGTNVSTGNSTGYGLSYATGGLTAGFASETTTGGALGNAYKAALGFGPANSVETTDLTKTAYGISYNFGLAKIAFQGLTAKKTADKIDTLGYGISVPFGAVTVNLSASNETDTLGTATAAKFAGSQLGASYALSKRTSVYFLNGSYKQTSGATAQAADSAKQTSFGVSHSF